MGDIAADGHMVVGDALCGPDAADLVAALTQYFHLPHLLAVGDGDALSAVAIAVLFNETPDETYGITCVVASHKGHAFQLFNHEHSVGVT